VSGLLVLIDGNSLIHRAYHALPDLTTSDGVHVGAVYGFAQTVLKLLEDHPPTAAVVAFDLPGPTFRHLKYPAYKGTRPPTPPDLISQFALVREFVDACRLESAELEGYEADDVIGTLAVRGAEAGMKVLIISIDRDCLQLVNEDVHMLAPSRGNVDEILYDPEKVQESYGYPPERVPDAKALIGDPSDNIPGVPKIGKKTAAKLLAQHGSLEEILSHPEDVRAKTSREYIEQHPDAVRAARELATIVTEAPVGMEMTGLSWEGIDAERAREFLMRMEFRRLAERLPGGPVAQTDVDTGVLARAADVIGWCEDLSTAKAIGTCTLTHRGVVRGVALSSGSAQARFVPIEFVAKPATQMGLFDEPDDQGDDEDDLARQAVKALLEDARVIKCGGGLKRQSAEFHDLGIEMRGLGFDVELASYVLEPHRRDHTVGAVAGDILGQTLSSLIVDREPQPEAACVWAAVAPTLEEPMRKELAEAELIGLLDDVEVPLVDILLRMERAGIAVDVEKLTGLGDQMRDRLADLQAAIHEHAGGPFNIESPKQLADVLFDKLDLPVQKRTKTGPSTDAEVLEKLEDKHPIIPLIGEYRTFAKLRSTYVDALAELAKASAGRVHTTFEQTVAATGRLSSRDPNLQNIPIRTEWGAKIRSCFVAGSPDMRLIAADYSQIELRLLAHFSQDQNLLDAFRGGEDIHRRTASEVFEVPVADVTSDMRRQAKTVNFAVIYGMGASSLAQQIGVTREEAARFIENYFSKLPGVKRYLTETLEQARAHGYAMTLMGRRRAFPELTSGLGGDRAYAERAAVNSPLQGTAADIIKVAMVQLDRELSERGLACRLLLQVHDELLLEVPTTEVVEVAGLVKEVMENAFELSVPLYVDVSVGENWRDLEPISPRTG